MHRDFVRTFETKEGQRVLRHVLMWTSAHIGINEPPVAMTASEASLFFEGCRRIGFKLTEAMNEPADGDQEVGYGGRERG